MAKFAISILLILLNTTGLFSETGIIERSSGKMPKWIQAPPAGFENDYYVGIGTSQKSYSDARNIALLDALKHIGEARNIQISSTSEFQIVEHGNGGIISQEFLRNIKVESEKHEIRGISEQESYFEKTTQNGEMKYGYWILIRLPKKDRERYSPPNSFSYVWRSTILPGWGQFHKGQKFKGTSFILLEAGLLTTAYLSAQRSANYHDSALFSRKVPDIEWYQQQTDKYHTISTGSWVVAGALYIYNLFDAITAKGEKVYVLNGGGKPERFAFRGHAKSQIMLSYRIPL